MATVIFSSAEMVVCEDLLVIKYISVWIKGFVVVHAQMHGKHAVNLVVDQCLKSVLQCRVGFCIEVEGSIFRTTCGKLKIIFQHAVYSRH